MTSRQPLLRITVGLVVLAALGAVSCGREARVTRPSASASPHAPASPASVVMTPGQKTPGQAVLVLAPGVNAAAWCDAHGLQRIVSLSTGAHTHHWVRSLVSPDDPDLYLEFTGPDVVQSTPVWWVWAPEGNGEPMVFDDGGLVPAGSTPNYVDQPSIAQIALAPAQALSQGAGAKVAILDTGVDRTHPALAGTSFGAKQPDFTVLPPVLLGLAGESRNGINEDGDGWTDEAYGHGTHVAGIVHRVAPQATLLTYKVLNDDGFGYSMAIAAAIYNAVFSGADVINLSLGFAADDPVVDEYVAFARSHGVAVIASAGNRAANEAQWPAANPDAFSVGSVDAQDRRARFSNWNATVDLAAPGVDIVSCIPPLVPGQSNLFARGNGCSFAVPWVAGAAALVKSYRGVSGYDAAVKVRDAGVAIDALNPGCAGGLGRRLDAGAAMTW